MNSGIADSGTLWRGRAWRLAPLLAALAAICFWAFFFRNQVMDDAYIGFRYIANLLSGQGFVFNPPEHVEGVTNTGWLLLLAPFALVAGEVVAAKVLGWAFLLAAILFAYQAAWRLRAGGSPMFAAGVPLLMAALFELVFFSQAGMETGLLAALLCAIAWLGVSGAPPAATAVVGAVVYLVHPEAVLVYPLIAVLSVTLRVDSWRRHLAPVFVFAGLLALITLARYTYFGDVLPNTFHAKPAETQTLGGLLSGWLLARNLNLSWPMRGYTMLILTLFGALQVWRISHRAAVHLFAIVVVGTAFGMYAFEDWTGSARYAAPYAPAALLLYWRGMTSALAALEKRFSGLKATPLAGLILAVLLAMEVGDTLNRTRPPFTQRYPGYVMTSESLAEPARWMGENLPKDAVIATRRIGALGYYSRLRLFDYCFGLADRDVTRLVRQHHKHFDMPTDPALETLWRQVSPDYLLEDRRYIENIARQVGGGADSFTLFGIKYCFLRAWPLGLDAEWVLCKKAN